MKTEHQEGIVTVEVKLPKWAEGKHIDEIGFCREFLTLYPMAYCDGCFFTEKGRMTEQETRKQLYDYLCGFFKSGLVKKTDALLEVLKLECRNVKVETPEYKLVCANGVYDICGGWLGKQQAYYRYRLPVNYNPNAPEPVRWKRFLEDLLEPEDILTLQEYMGYCLLPIPYAQKMLLIIGSGGEGKSRIGIVLSALMGSCMANGSLAKLENSPFARADLQHRLVMVDDDLRLEALNNTNYIKSIITAEQPMDLERKGVQSYQARIHCRLLAFGNGNLRSLHDRSHGFFRRQIILTTREKPAGRVDEPYLASYLKEELEGILLWCIEGVQRLMTQKMRFTISHRARENLRQAMTEGNNLPEFFQSEGYFRFDPQGKISSRRLYALYRDWCDDNMTTALSARTAFSWIQQNAGKYGLTFTYHIPGGDGRHVRGYLGIRPAGRV